MSVGTSVQVTLDGSGAAHSVLDGPPWGYRWVLRRMTSSTTETAGSAALRLYRSSTSPTSFLLGTEYARQDVSDGDPPIILYAGEQLVMEWTAGTPGAQATVALDLVQERHQ